MCRLQQRFPDMTKTASSRGAHGHSVFSFFSGAGFLDIGFEVAGFDIAFANEIHPEFVEAYRHARSAMGLPLPRHGIACDSIDDHLQPPAAAVLASRVAGARELGQSVGFIGGPRVKTFL